MPAIRPSRRRSRAAWIVLAALALPAAAGIAFALWPRPEPPPEPLPVAEPPAAPLASAPAPAEPPAPPRSIELRFATTPSDATITWDGMPVTPPIVIEPDDAEHEVRVRAPGYRERMLRVTADRDQDLEVVLARARRSDRALPVKLREW